MRVFLILAALLSTGPAASSPILQVQSQPEQVAVLELFTSHGCSSCPPADKWLRRFVDHPGLWTEVIPMAFHVDYWDSLGWPDRFASRAFSDRQRDYRRRGRIGAVYTPGFVVGGREWRGWFRGKEPPLKTGQRVGTLSLSLDRERSALLSFAPASGLAGSTLTAHLAVLGFGISTPVGGGENAGRVLEEDFVVLGYGATADAQPSGEWRMDLPKTGSRGSSRLAVVAWVSVDNDPAPIQAVAGWLP
ncbi:MAG: DUF1223 domain-containing protein [Gammaproteobacteria bacterium]|nr:DUF1223 domain-containing protein [Gammaproteobacteria bacterium]